LASEGPIREEQKEHGSCSSQANPGGHESRSQNIRDREDGQHGLMEIIGNFPPAVSHRHPFVYKSSALGFLTATSFDDNDLAVVSDVCERASATEANAKEATEALGRDFKCILSHSFHYAFSI
jgi:hypothetical protein